MDNTISVSSTSRADVVAVQTQPRPTATPVRVQFADVLAGGAQALVRGAQAAVSAIPGAPLAAVAVRGGGSSAAGGALSGLGGLRSVASAVTVGTPEGPGGTTAGSGLGAGLVSVGGTSAGVGGASTGTTSDGGLESTMAQSEQMNLYYLQVQEEVNAQNRTYTALSNVLEVEHSTAKSAIGNIH
jgi:hypothetical protein